MRLGKKYHLFLISSLLWCFLVAAQTTITEPLPDSVAIKPANVIVEIGDIDIIGNKKTKRFIILRELTFKNGETYPLDVLVEKFESARNQLMNSALFHTVSIAAKNFEGNKINILITVKERWYLFPIPFLSPVDRNLNQWIVEQKASLDRVNYGIKFLYNNATGRNDKIKLGITNGYTKELSVSYDKPYIDKKLKWGARVSFNAGKNREINYNTIGNKQAFYKDDNAYVRNFINGFAELSYRKAIKTRHSFIVGYNMESITDTIVDMNPSYFNGGRKKINFPEFNYVLTFFNLDYIPYPTKGYALQVIFKKKGINKAFNLWQLDAHATGSWPVSPKYFFNLNVYAGIKAPFKQPFYAQRFLGYGDRFVQGYEYYVIDGALGGYVKATMTRELLNFNIKVPAKKGKTPQQIPIRIFGKVYGNTGYVYNPLAGENYLSNKMLYSGGFGIDILTFYDVTFKLEYSFNAVGQNGLFLHRKSIF